MRYLKRFNENIEDKESFINELQDFCDVNLAYLTDNDVRVVVGKADLDPEVLVRVIFDKTKSWDEVKDQIIPFIIRLNNKYEISKFFGKHEIKVFIDYAGHFMGSGEDFCSVKDIIEDKKELCSEMLFGLLFYVKGYKQPKKSLMTKIKSFFK